MKKILQNILLALSASFASTFAMAHAGHDHGSLGFIFGLIHPITGFDHLVMLVAFGLVVGCLSVSRLRKMALIGVALIMLHLGVSSGKVFGSFSGVEFIILSSLFIVSAILWRISNASQKMLKLAAALCISLMFFHGYAHGVEAQGALVAFSLGMAITATFLMSLGITLGQYIASRWGAVVVRWVSLGVAFAPMLARANTGYDHGSSSFFSVLIHPTTGFEYLMMLVGFGLVVGCLFVSKDR